MEVIHDKSNHIGDGVCDNVNVDTYIMGLVSGLVRTQYAKKYYFKHDCAHLMWNLNFKVGAETTVISERTYAVLK